MPPDEGDSQTPRRMLRLSEVWRRLRSDPRAIIGLIILGIILLLAIFAPLIAPHDPHEQHQGIERLTPAPLEGTEPLPPAPDLGQLQLLPETYHSPG